MREPKETRKVAEEAVRLAGSFLRLMSIDNLELFRKKGHLVSSFDIEAERLIKNRIAMTYPEDRVVTDFTDTGSPDSEGALTWYVDPLDGTKAFIRGQLAFVSLSAAVVDAQGLVAAAIYNPFTDVLYSASRTEQAFLNDRGLTRPDDVDLTKARMLVDFSRDIPEATQVRLATADLSGEVGRIFRFDGSIAQHLALIAQGTLDGAVLWGSGTKGHYYDLAGAILLLEKLHFKVTDLGGNPIGPESRSFDQLVVGQPSLHQQTLNFVRRIAPNW